MPKLQMLSLTLMVLLSQLCVTGIEEAKSQNSSRKVDFGPLDFRLGNRNVLEATFPDADEISRASGTPPTAAVYQDGKVIGYLYATYETIGARGYAGEPFDVVAGVDLNARISGVYLLFHNEPIVKGRLPMERGLRNYLEELRNLNILKPIKKPSGGKRGGRFSTSKEDGISGATVSATLMHGAVVSSARSVARAHGLIVNREDEKISLDLDLYESVGWRSLLVDGSVQCRQLKEGDSSNIPEEICISLITPAGIGRNLFGDKQHGVYVSEIEHGEQLLWIGSRGKNSWTALSQYTEPPPIYLKQGKIALPLTLANQLRGASLPMYSRTFHPENSRHFNDTGILKIAAGIQFQSYLPWRLEFDFAFGNGEEGGGLVPPTSLEYQIPAKYVVGADFDLEEAGLKPITYVLGGLVRESKLTDWQRAWVQQALDIALLVALLLVVTIVLVFEGVIARRRFLHRWVRISTLTVVLIWLGWIAGAQLSIVNVFAYAQAIAGRLEWSTLLFEPLIVILAGYTAVSLVLLGRGVFCGWLCPFGALQELLNQLARFARVPQFTPTFTLNESLWAIKYLVIVVLVGVSVFWSLEAGLLGTEIEPFKTAITLKFDRTWPYAMYAILLLVAGLFMERFFCRFLCPLGGALAILGRFHVFQWLKRRPECGSPCHICEVSCPVQAVEPSGKINMNECFQCLDCQVDYYDDSRCPPLVSRRKRKERITPPSLHPVPNT